MLLEIDSINSFYGDMQSLFNLSFSMEEGDILSIVGSNGAGKSTLLNALSGIFHPKSGSICFCGNRIEKASTHSIVEMGLIQVPEGRRLFPLMTVLENLELGSYSANGRKNRTHTLNTVFKIFPILEMRKNQTCSTLSGGEQQMVAIARGLMARPKLLMLDEPSLGLAPLMVKQVFQIVKQINQEGISILLVEQNVFHSLAVAHKGCVLENGKIVLQGEGKSLIENEMVKKAYLGI
jgi:branched-chain amino acid transport system ATP-binding protein